jgi:hypothetical protein
VQTAVAELCHGYPCQAQRRLSSLPPNNNVAQYWLSSLISLSLEDVEAARTGLETYLGRKLHSDEPVTFATWVRAWDNSASELRSNASFYFPKLPSELTRLDQDIVRLQGSGYTLDAATLAVLPDRAPRRPEDSEDIVQETDNPSTDAVANLVPALINVNVSQEGTHVGDKNIVGQAAAVGSHASASNVTFQQWVVSAKIDMEILAQELERLRMALREQPSFNENDEALAEISRASRAAVQGDEEKVASHLRATGQWALRTANTIGLGSRPLPSGMH